MVMDPRGGPAVPSEPWQRPPPRTCGSLTWLFPRYVQEVIQRGRSCVRPACTPVLSVVPAVSDLELSETEYVRPRAGPAYPGARGGAAAPGTGSGAPHWKRRGWAQASCPRQRRRGPYSRDMRPAGQRGSSAVPPRPGPCPPPAFTSLSFLASPGARCRVLGLVSPGSAV